MHNADRLNVVLICTDQQRYDSLGCTGNVHAVTPRIDALAAESCVLDRHFTANPVCMPSRATLMTGCYPSAHGVWTNGTALPSRDGVAMTDRLRKQVSQNPGGRVIPSHLPTLAELFAAAGYATASVGKLHLTPTQSHRDLGFEESQDRWNNDPAMADWHGPYRGFEHVDLTLDHGGAVKGHYLHWLNTHHPQVVASIRRSAEQPRQTSLNDAYPLLCPVETYCTMWVADRACDAIDRYAQGDRPFLLWVGIPDPHSPFTPPAEIAETFAARDALPAHREPPDGGAPPRAVARMRDDGMLPEDAVALARRYTDGMIHLIDRAVGQIIDQLKASGQWERTVLVFTSDHGDYLGDYGVIRKNDHACRVLNHTPLILRVPGASLPHRSPAAVSNADVLPTLCGVCDVAGPSLLHGEDVRDVMASGRRRPVMIQSSGGPPQDLNISIVDDRHRLTWYPQADHVELYDHERDPMEWRNLADDPRAVGVRDDLLQSLQRHFIQATTPRYGRVSTW
jgi:arylsulfatase A-like enzyme